VLPTRRLLLVLGLAVTLGCAWLAPLDSSATRYVEAGLQRALISFASARTLCAVISVVQGTELELQPGGVGVTLTPGRVLEPINDLAQQFSLLMLAASVSFGIQLALIKFGAFWAVSLLLTVVALAWAWMVWRRRPVHEWMTRFLLALLLVRFAMPVIALGSEAAFQLFLQDDYATSQAGIEKTTGHLNGISESTAAAQPDENVSDRIKRWWSNGTDVKQRYADLKEAAGLAIEHIIKLIVVFLLQTLVLPLLLLWLLIRLSGLVGSLATRGAPIR
jgi:hypothetical protein